METARVVCLEGPNVWSKSRMIEVRVELAAGSSATLAERLRRLVSWWNDAEGAVRPSDFPTFPWPIEPDDEAELLALVVINLQRRVHLNVEQRVCDANPSVPDRAVLAIEVVEFSVGRLAWELGRDLWHATLSDDVFDLSSRLRQLRDVTFDICLGQTTGTLVHEARSRGIPVLRLDDISLVQLGYGSRQRRLQTAISGHSSFIAESVSRDKALTKNLLHQIGLPVPVGRVVIDAEEAWETACEIGLPVVVKPRDADYGNGVSLKLSSRDEVQCAFERALRHSAEVIVERYLEGAHHRVLVVGGKVIAAVRFERAVVVGDGERTVAELIDELNRDPRRGTDHDSTWFWLEADEEIHRVLASQGSSLDHRPAVGQKIVLRLEPRIGWGGGLFDVTDDVHPEVAAVVADAVEMVGLDIAGVDLIADDISRPLGEQQGGLLEVNAGPAILMHLQPYSDPPRPVPEAIISHLFPEPEAARIPLVAICGDDEHSSVTNQVTRLLERTCASVGRATREGVFIGTRTMQSRSGANLSGARMLLMNPKVDSAAVEVSLAQIRFEGLAFDQCQIAIVMRIDTQERDALPAAVDNKLAALHVLLDSTRQTGTAILNLDNTALRDTAGSHRSNTIGYSVDAANPAIVHLQQAGGQCVFLRNGTVILSRGRHEFPLPLLGHADDIPLAQDSSPSTLLATVAAAWALNLPPDSLREVLWQSTEESTASSETRRRLRFPKPKSHTDPQAARPVRQQVT